MNDPSLPSRAPLETLVGRARAEEFARSAWWPRPFVAHGSVDRFGISRELVSAPYDELIRDYEGERRVWCNDRHGAQRMIQVHDGDLAACALHSGSAVTLEFIDRTPHFDAGWGLEVIEALGYPAVPALLAVTCFVTPAGTGANKHLDAAPFFILQVRGRKHWWVAENREAPHPLEGWGPSWVTPVPPELRAHAARISGEMPPDCEHFELGPGDVLYVPGGAWHRTHCDETSLSLSFIPRVPSWAQVIIDHLVEHLRAQPAWRAPAVGLSLPGGDEASARAHLDGLLEPLRAELRELDARTLLERATLRAMLPQLSAEELWSPRYRAAAATIRGVEDGLELITEHAEITVDRSLAALCRWALESTSPFCIAAACERARGVLAPREVVSLLRTLVEACALVDEFSTGQ
ncbi:JmjC domain-containing protein [Paraliomyxa miuraensis]|uniref:JmjC domain-containing protein n=1 Tax=Paraliomyxa miuraensis TaxID=376150 RepID=UPI00224F99C5|nr:cupin domain-containing protein [Paraliomyxa miuraensis]MCX4242643.1 cupin domain-containing protein [Paraliomyxa miuraensis]